MPKAKESHIVLFRWKGATPNIRVPDGWATLGAQGGFSAGIRLDDEDSKFSTRSAASRAVDAFLDDQAPVSSAIGPLNERLDAFIKVNGGRPKKALELLLKQDPEARQLHKQIAKDESQKAIIAWMKNWEFKIVVDYTIV